MGSEGKYAEPESDVALMLRVREGDETAFSILYRRYYRKVLNFFYGLCRHAPTADDLCQETFLRVWKLKNRYAATGSYPAYLFTVARNIWLEKCRDYRKQARLGTAQSIDLVQEILEDHGATQPSDAAWHREVGARIFEVLGELPEEQRMVFVMRAIEGLPVEEIAAIMQCPVNTVRSRKILALKKLREALRGLLVL